MRTQGAQKRYKTHKDDIRWTRYTKCCVATMRYYKVGLCRALMGTFLLLYNCYLFFSLFMLLLHVAVNQVVVVGWLIYPAFWILFACFWIGFLLFRSSVLGAWEYGPGEMGRLVGSTSVFWELLELLHARNGWLGC